MTDKKVIRVLEHIERYLTTHTNESCEEEHTAINRAIKAVRIVEVIENAFSNQDGAMIDAYDWRDIKASVEEEADDD